MRREASIAREEECVWHAVIETAPRRPRRLEDPTLRQLSRHKGRVPLHGARDGVRLDAADVLALGGGERLAQLAQLPNELAADCVRRLAFSPSV